MKTHLHGESQLNKIEELPAGVKEVKTNGEYHIIAESEISGNHHVIDLNEDVKFYEKDGIFYMKNDTETQVRCIVKERHDAITLEPGVWEIDFQQEYDYLKKEIRRVSD